MNLFTPDARDDVVARLRELDRCLLRRYADDRVSLDDIVEFPH